MRTKNSFLNMITNLLPSLIIPVLSLIKLNWLLSTYGDDVYGLNLYLAQVIGYLSFVEGGFGIAFIQALFKPLADGDKEKVKELYQGANVILKVMGGIILGIGIVVYILLPNMLTTPLTDSFVRIVFLLLLLPTAIDYFLLAPSLVMQADQKEYYLNIIRKVVQILRIVTHMIIIKLQLSYLYIPLAEAIYILLQVFISRILVFKKYPYLKEKAKKDYSTLSNTRYTFLHKLAGIVLTSTDTLLLGKMIGTGANALYGNYNYISSELQKLMESVVNAPRSSLGNLFAAEKEKGYSVFKEFFTFASFLSTVVAIPMCITIGKFVELWQGEEYVLSFICSFFFAGILYLVITRQPIMLVRDTNGYFRETRKFSYIEAILNVVFSIVGIKYFGITGALAVTFMSYLVSDLFMNSIFVYKHVFNKNIVDYYKMYFSKIVLMILVGLGAYYLWNGILINSINGFIMWFVMAGLLFVAVLIVIFIIYKVLFSDFQLFINRIMKMIKNEQ